MAGQVQKNIQQKQLFMIFYSKKSKFFDFYHLLI